MRAALALWSALAVAPLHAEPGLKEAAALYHRGRYDSALAVLDVFRPGIHKRRDSLSLFQYAGMASARLGREEQAAADFRVLLGLDSLFQFPRNEDAAILQAFAKAQASRNAETDTAAAAAPGDSSAIPPRVASAGDGSAAPLQVRANLPGELAPIPTYPDPRLANPAPYAPRAEPVPRRSGIGMALGAIPLGGGWLAEGRYQQGLALAFLQFGGAALSVYASSRITAAESDLYGTQDAELGNVHKWQWTQRISFSLALGSYLYSLIASRRP